MGDNPKFVESTAKIAAHTPEVAATDKSISPRINTTVIPTARVPTTALCMKR